MKNITSEQKNFLVHLSKYEFEIVRNFLIISDFDNNIKQEYYFASFYCKLIVIVEFIFSYRAIVRLENVDKNIMVMLCQLKSINN